MIEGCRGRRGGLDDYLRKVFDIMRILVYFGINQG